MYLWNWTLSCQYYISLHWKIRGVPELIVINTKKETHFNATQSHLNFFIIHKQINNVKITIPHTACNSKYMDLNLDIRAKRYTSNKTYSHNQVLTWKQLTQVIETIAYNPMHITLRIKTTDPSLCNAQD